MRIRLKIWVKIVLILIFLITCFFLYSFYLGTKGLIVKEYPITDSKMPSNFYGLKIVQISDIHYKVTTDLNYLNKMVKKINLLKPDIVILNGDLFDKNIRYTKNDYNNVKKILNSIDYNIGKYAIKGENDLNIEEWENIILDSNFINLNDTYELIYSNGTEPILMIGISSNYKKNHIKDTLNDIYSKIENEYKYSILMLHEPDIIDEIEYNKFNLILAGHSHNGQIVLPYIGGIIKDKYAKKYYDNYYELNDTKIFISSGIGTHKYKLRFLNKPSINFYRLRNK